MFTVGDLMTTDPMTVTPSDSAADVFDMMASYHIRHVPVVDGAGELVGLVTHRDLLQAMISARDEHPSIDERTFLQETAVSDVMTVDVDVAEESTPLAEAADLMVENKYGCLPVVDSGALVGILTESDFVIYVARQVANG